MGRIRAFYRRYSVAGPVATVLLLWGVLERILHWIGLVDQVRSMMDPTHWFTEVVFWPHLDLVISGIGLVLLVFLIVKERSLIKVDAATLDAKTIRELRLWDKQRDPTRRVLPKSESNQTSRLSQVKKQLRGYILEADQMYDKVLAEKVATQSLPEAERRGRLSVFVPPDCRRWHSNVKVLTEKELGGAQANEFASEYISQWEGYDWSDLDFLMKFLSRKRNRLRDLANRITEADLEQ